jgi:tRNA(Ile)-lysidine synthase
MLRKARLVATCRAEGWPYIEDSSNADPRFLRARLRAGLMPALAAEGLTPERIGTLARRAARTEDALAARAESVLAAARLPGPEGRLELDGTVLAAEPDAILLGVVARAIVEVTGAETRPVRLERWEALVLGDLRRALDSGESVRMTLGRALLDLGRDGRLVLRREPPRRPRPARRARDADQ